MTPSDRDRLLARVRAERVAQGLTPTITDPAVLGLLAAVIAGGGRDATTP